MLKIAQEYFFLVFIVDYNPCALNSRPSKKAIEARTLKIIKERLGQARQAKQKLSALTQLQGKQCSAEEAQFGFGVETEHCSCCNTC